MALTSAQARASPIWIACIASTSLSTWCLAAASVATLLHRPPNFPMHALMNRERTSSTPPPGLAFSRA